MQTLKGRVIFMGRHRKWDDEHGPGWPTTDPDDDDERTVRNMPPIPDIPPISS